ncbi:MAG: metal-dependent transcriptional regulator [Intestinibacillus sp.]
MKELHESGENYLEVILDIQREQGRVRSVEVARRVGVSRASVSKALGVLREAGLVEPSFYGAVVLTEAGFKRAKEVRARHDLLCRFLRDGLGVPAEIAEQDACRIEHIVSREALAHISRWMYRQEHAGETAQMQVELDNEKQDEPDNERDEETPAEAGVLSEV